MSSMFEVTEGIVLPTGEEVPTVEHAYHAEKYDNEDLRAQIIAAPTGQKAKRVADRLNDEGYISSIDWNYRKVDVMRNFVYQKFTRSEELHYKLMDTGSEKIIEGNTWNDTFWGVYPLLENGKLAPDARGLNWLGRVIMETRAQLRAEDFKIVIPEFSLATHSMPALDR